MARARRQADAYEHQDEAVLRPEVGTQAQFRKRKPPKRYRYDSSLSPALDWDGQNAARELGEWLLACIEDAARLVSPHRFEEPRRFGDVEVAGLHDAVERLKALSGPFLDWAGKAERLSFDVPTLPLFVHERLSTKAILETLKGHERDRQMEMQLFADPRGGSTPTTTSCRSMSRRHSFRAPAPGMRSSARCGRSSTTRSGITWRERAALRSRPAITDGSRSR